jgi:hypothetical protein
MRGSLGLDRSGMIGNMRQGASTSALSRLGLVVNGNFDLDTSSWSGTNATLASVAGGQNGNCLRITNVGTIGCAYQQIIAPAGSYRVRLYSKNGNQACYISISQNPYDYGGMWNASMTYPAWSLLDQIVTFTTPNPYINLWVNSLGAGDYCYFDEVQITPNP